MNVLITDINNFNEKYISEYDAIEVVIYSNYSVDDFDKFDAYDNVYTTVPTSNYDKAYNVINSRISELTKNDLVLLSMLKLARKSLFNIGLLLITINKYSNNDRIVLECEYNDDIKMFLDHENISYIKSRGGFKKIKFISFCKMIALYFIYFFHLFIPNTTKEKNKDHVFMDFDFFSNLGGIQKKVKNSVIFDQNLKSYETTFKTFKSFMKEQLTIINYFFKYPVLGYVFHMQAFSYHKYLRIINEFNPKSIIGTFDTYLDADIGYRVAKKNNIKFVCISHSFNYDFRMEYIYLPFDMYFVWSEAHKAQVIKGNYISNKDCEFFIVGAQMYKNKKYDIETMKNLQTKKYDILIIGEYYVDDFSWHSFNPIATKRLANVLLELSSKYKICIRPRSNDAYYKDMYSILGDKVDYSVPTYANENRSTITKDILSSKLVYGVFTNGIHDALFANVPVVQVNFILEKSPKDLAKENFAYYADNEEKLLSITRDFLSGKLNELDFAQHNNIYLHDGKHELDFIVKKLTSQKDEGI